LVGADQQRLFGEVGQVLPVGLDAAGDGLFAGGLRRAIVPPGDPDAGCQSTQVPLPCTGVCLVEVVEVEDELAFG
jgi:hypothetical protein